MKVYRHGLKDRNAFIFVEPGQDFPDVEGWSVQERNPASGLMQQKPVQFAVKFNDGVAEVDDNLGNYMIDKKLAKRDMLAEPEIEVIPQFDQRPEQRVFK